MWMPRPPDVFGNPGVAEVVQQHASLAGDAHGVGEVRAGLGVEVDAQLVGVVDVVCRAPATDGT